MTSRATPGGTVGKAIEVLETVASMERPVRFTELLTDSPHPKATLYRLLQTLVGLGLLSYDEGSQNYSHGLRLVGLAHSAWKQASLAPVARPFLDALATRVDKTVHLAQLDKGQVLYVDKRQPSRPLDMFSDAGKVGPAYCTGIGKAMLAFLDGAALERAMGQQSYYRYTPTTLTSAEALKADLKKIRDAGVAFDQEEHEPDIICIAAPILSAQTLIGGLSITTSPDRHGFDDLERAKPELLETASQIGEAASNWLFPRAN